jgi:hypothetical protein
MVKRGDKVKVINVVNTDRAAERPDAVNSMLGDSAVHIYYTQECSKATASSGCSFEFVQVPNALLPTDRMDRCPRPS